MVKGIETILMMIPKGGKYATSVVNKVYNFPKNWEKFTRAVQQIEKFLKQRKLRLDGKQTTIFESNKNILKNHEKVTKKYNAEVDKAAADALKQVSKDPKDYFKGWTPTLVERSILRNVYNKKLDPPERLYTKEMEKIDEELDALAFGGEKYEGLSTAAKAKIFQKLQAEMKKLIKVAKENDPTKLSLSQINKKSQDLQRRIREIADNPDIKGTVTEGPKKDMIAALYDSENAALMNARKVITKRNSELKYGTKYPVLDPENNSFIILKLDERGNPIKMSRFTGKFSATKDKTTGELTSGEGTSFYDKWNAETNQMRKEGEEVFTNTLNREGKEIMSNPAYKIPKTPNMDIQTEFYTDLSSSELAKKGYKLKQIDMIIKGREARKYLERNKSLDPSISMHEQTSSNEIGAVMEDLYNRGDDIYKMTMKEWITKIPEYFAEGGRTGFKDGTYRDRLQKDYESLTKGADFFRVTPPKWWLFPEKYGMNRDDVMTFFKERFMYGEPPKTKRTGSKMDQAINDWIKEQYKKLVGRDEGTEGLATGGISNLFRERQGYRDPGLVIKFAKGARWVIRMLKELSDDMIFGSEQFAKMAEPAKIKLYKEIQAAIKHLEAGGEIPKNLIQTLRQDARFKNLTVSKGGDKDFLEIQEVVLGKTNVEKTTAEKLLEKQDDIIKHMTHDFKGKPYKDVAQTVEGKVIEQEYLDKGIAEGAVEQIEKIDLMKFKNTLPKDLLDKVNQVPIEKQTNLLIVMKRAFDAAKKGNIDKGVDVLQKQLLEDFIPKGKGNAEGGLIDGYATGGVSNLFRQRYRSGKAVELVTKLPEFLKFVERLLIKASNEIRQGIGKWKGLTTSQKVAQHDNLTKLATEFQKTKKFDKSFNEYFGIDAEKAFIEAQAKVKKPKVKWESSGYSKKDMEQEWDFEMKLAKQEKSIFSMTKEEKAARLKKYQEETGIKLSYGDKDKRLIPPGTTEESLDLAILKGNFERKYTGVIDDRLMKQVLADNDPQRISEVMATIDQSLAMQKKGMSSQSIMDTLKESFTRKKQATGGLIPGYATGGVSNLFRSR